MNKCCFLGGFIWGGEGEREWKKKRMVCNSDQIIKEKKRKIWVNRL